MANKFRILIQNNEGWWSATCEDLHVEGCGHTQEEAIEALKLAMQAKFLAGQRALEQDRPIETFADVAYA